jgi:hypothetical protein
MPTKRGELFDIMRRPPLDVDKTRDASRLPFVRTSVTAQLMSQLFLRLSLLLGLSLLFEAP